MRKIYVLFSLLLLSCMAWAQSEARISGKLTEVKTDTVKIVIFEDLISHRKKTGFGLVSENQEFECSIPLTSPRWAYLLFNQRQRRVYLTPGDEMSAMLDSNKVAFQGEGSEINNFLAAYDDKYESVAFHKSIQEKIKTLSATDYRAFQDKLKSEKLAYIESNPFRKYLSAPFVSFLQAEIIYSHASALIDYPNDHAHLTQTPPVKDLPAGYFNFMTDIKVLNEDALNQVSVAYFNFLRYDYITYEARLQSHDFKHDNEQFFANQYEFVKNSMKSIKDRFLYFTLAGILYSGLNYGNVNTIENSYTDFVKTNPFKEYADLLAGPYQTAKAKTNK